HHQLEVGGGWSRPPPLQATPLASSLACRQLPRGGRAAGEAAEAREGEGRRRRVAMGACGPWGTESTHGWTTGEFFLSQPYILNAWWEGVVTAVDAQGPKITGFTVEFPVAMPPFTPALPFPLFCGARVREMGQKQVRPWGYARQWCMTHRATSGTSSRSGARRLLLTATPLFPLSPSCSHPSRCRCFSPCSPPCSSPCSSSFPPPLLPWLGYREMGQKQVRPWELRPSMVYDTQGHLWHHVKIRGASLAAYCHSSLPSLPFLLPTLPLAAASPPALPLLLFPAPPSPLG
ncbi:unnamed protein product, partial [Closterium sp. NIES-65]